MKTRKKYFKKGSKRKYLKKRSRRKTKQKKSKIKNFRKQKGGVFWDTLKDTVGSTYMHLTRGPPSPPPSPENKDMPVEEKMNPDILWFYESQDISFNGLTKNQKFGIGSLISPDGTTCEFCKQNFNEITGYEDEKICKIIEDRNLIDNYDNKRELTLLEKKYIHSHFFYHIHKDNQEAIQKFTLKLNTLNDFYENLKAVVLPDIELYVKDISDKKPPPEELTPPKPTPE